jgi:hypothetical protein
LDVLDGQRLGVLERGVVRELGSEDFFEGLALRGDRREAVSDPLLGGCIAPAGLLGDGDDDRLVEGLGFGGKVLILANRLRQPIAARRKARPNRPSAALDRARYRRYRRCCGKKVVLDDGLSPCRHRSRQCDPAPQTGLAAPNGRPFSFIRQNPS